MNKNTNLHTAKKEKNDEFYTLYQDIEKEMKEMEENSFNLEELITIINSKNNEFNYLLTILKYYDF